MKLFSRRKKINAGLLPEVQAFSQAERRERMGIAWLVGLVSLLITLALAAVLFLGGRWAYRKLAHKDKPTPVVTENNSSTSEDQVDTVDDKDGTENSQEGTDNVHDSSQNSGEPTPDTSVESVPSTGPESSPTDTLPNTGPDVDL